MNRSAALSRRSELKRVTLLRRGDARLKRTPLGHCTPAQRERVADRACIVCRDFAGQCHPAHLVDRALTSAEMADDVRAVIPLCFACHIEYDHGDLDLSPHLEPEWHDSVVWAVDAVGLFHALYRITGKRWAPVEDPLARPGGLR